MMELDRRLFLAGVAGTALAARAGIAAPAKPAPAPVNPLVKNRADAQIFRHDDGHYYITGSVPEYDRLILRRSRTLAGLATAEERVLWRHLSTGPLSGFIWAPELHLIDGRWIMYFAAGPSGGGEDVFRIRTWAIACDGPDPMTGNWSVLGQFQAPWDSFNLDSTSFVHHGRRYFAWAQREPGIETNSNLYIAPLAKDPLKLAAKATRLTVPTLPWEIQGYKVAEAPAVLARNGRLFMTYSASATDARYCLGMLTAADDADIMDANAWTKSPEPVFTTSKITNVYGPGHNSFTIDEQGRDVLIYHGRDYEAITGDPLFDPNRHTRMQRLYYKPDGTPDFGIPVGNGAVPDRYSPIDAPGSYIFHDGDTVRVGKGSLPATQFRTAPATTGSVTLTPIDAPDRRLAIAPDGTAHLGSDDGTPSFARNSTFLLAPTLGGVEIASADRPDRVLAHRNGALVAGPKSKGGKSAIFRIT